MSPDAVMVSGVFFHCGRGAGRCYLKTNETHMDPIWKDYDVDLTAHLTDGAAVYEIRKGSTVIYTGRAVADPDGNAVVRINGICADHLGHALPAVDATALVPDTAGVATFTVYVGGVLVDTVTFWNDWSYDYHFDASAGGVTSDPVLPVIDTRMPLLLSLVRAGVGIIPAPDFNSDFNSDFLIEQVQSLGPSTYVVAAGTMVAGDSVTFGGMTWKVVGDCRRWALYYVNAYGGWDSLLLREHETQTDAYDRKTIRRYYNNDDRAARGTEDYHIDVTRRWTFRTDVLTDAQAARMHHLIGTPLAYLYDLDNADFIPVLVRDAECVYKTFRNQGARRVAYDITLELAQDMTRR